MKLKKPIFEITEGLFISLDKRLSYEITDFKALCSYIHFKRDLLEQERKALLFNKINRLKETKNHLLKFKFLFENQKEKLFNSPEYDKAFNNYFLATQNKKLLIALEKEFNKPICSEQDKFLITQNRNFKRFIQNLKEQIKQLEKSINQYQKEQTKYKPFFSEKINNYDLILLKNPSQLISKKNSKGKFKSINRKEFLSLPFSIPLSNNLKRVFFLYMLMLKKKQEAKQKLFLRYSKTSLNTLSPLISINRSEAEQQVLKLEKRGLLCEIEATGEKALYTHSLINEYQAEAVYKDFKNMVASDLSSFQDWFINKTL